MSENRQIYLMRHARPELPFGGRVYYGQTDYPLSADGKTAAAALGALVRAGLPVAEFAAATGLLEHTFLDLEGGRS